MFGCQHQEDALQRKRVAQRTLLVREHTQAFDGGHLRCRLCYVSIVRVITTWAYWTSSIEEQKSLCSTMCYRGVKDRGSTLFSKRNDYIDEPSPIISTSLTQMIRCDLPCSCKNRSGQSSQVQFQLLRWSNFQPTLFSYDKRKRWLLSLDINS